MVSSRKRGREEMEAVESPKEPTLLERIRNTWEFANLAQWIFTFGRAVKIDENLDIEDLEMECLKHNSTVLPEIGLALLKFVSSHRGLTPEIFDEYTRRQYLSKAPERNPFGDDEESIRFQDLDVFTKLRVLQQLTQWTMGNPDRIRERMEEQKDSEQTLWRIEPFGWDSEDRTYIVLDDNRLYRRTDPPPPPPPAAKPKKNSKKAKAGLRASKRRKVSEPVESEADEVEATAEPEIQVEKEDDGFGGMLWECIAVTLDEFNAFIATIEKSRDANEKVLRKRITDDVLPLLEKQEESRQRKQAQKEQELLNLEKLATAKRSSRIAGKMESQKHEQEQRDAERKKHGELAMARKEQEKWQMLEKERESRMQTREQRLKERDARRILHEEELANLSDNSKKIEAGEIRLSDRQIKAEIERKKQALEQLGEEEDWIFDCICGAYGQIDDGTHSIACDQCNIWQHSKCVGVSQSEADREDFHFVCTTCQRRAKDAERAKTQPQIKLKFGRPGSSSSPAAAPPKSNGSPVMLKINGAANTQSSPQKPGYPVAPVQNGYKSPFAKPEQRSSKQSAPDALPQHPAPALGSPIYGRQASPQDYGKARPAAPTPNAAYNGPYGAYANSGKPIASPYGAPPPSHAFSSPRLHSPTSLPPPGQPPVYNFANGNAPPGDSAQVSSGTTAMHQGPSKMASLHDSASATTLGTFATPAPHRANGSRPGTSESDHRQSSLTMQSPLAGAPILTPSSKPYSASIVPASGVQNTDSTPLLIEASTPHATSFGQDAQQVSSQDHASALPSAATGLSPTKHSPPRLTAANGSFGSATPSILPPVASLSPSPRLQNLSPPVKLSEPQLPRPAGQAVGQ